MTMTMSTTTTTTGIETSSLCDLCKQVQDLDRLMDHTDPIMHHRSWTALCQSAEDGCKLCDAFVQFQELKSPPGRKDALTRNFDEHMSWPNTQLLMRPHGTNSLFILQQEALFHHPYREVVNIWFELCPKPDDPLSSIFTARDIDSTSNSDKSLALLDTWVQACKTEHSKCAWSNDHILPTRVIDVGSEHEEPFLLETNGMKGEWLTLSHCWGGGATLMTTSDTLQDHKSSIPIESLPATFRDAVFLTRRLGYRYIWIDSLCIIQNIHEDWTSESSQMFRVYTNASINLSASAARNPKDGIFESGNGMRKYSAPLTTLDCRSETKNMQGVVGVRPQLGGAGPFVLLPNEPLHRRAWVLQESVLSPRRIDFASTQLYWECRTALHTEGYPRSSDGESFLTASGRMLHRMETERMEENPDIDRYFRSAKDPISWWYPMLYDSYRVRGITMDHDVFPALAGVAEQVARRTGYHYKAGLWLEDLHRGLLWQSSDFSQETEDKSCPSWTWASVKLPSWDRRLNTEKYAACHRATIMDVKVNTYGENEFGRVRSGTLKLECMVKALTEWKEPLLPVYNEYAGDFDSMRMHTRYLHSDDSVRYVPPPVGRLLCTTDIRPDNADACHSDMIERRAICAQIASFKIPDCRTNQYQYDEEITQWGVVVYGLILEPIDESEKVYRRIGIVEIAEEDGLADNWETREVMIV
ncbi:heterokaryon incompatibility protein-domain-containing protein [Cadophora sp. MPI-SDFR-AT-0126]|nr:heterokaryon incompatibility protein-domain-containing protein [Leotiomycetes sp. MPI-SDFR-AT-0126]